MTGYRIEQAYSCAQVKVLYFPKAVSYCNRTRKQRLALFLKKKKKNNPFSRPSSIVINYYLALFAKDHWCRRETTRIRITIRWHSIDTRISRKKELPFFKIVLNYARYKKPWPIVRFEKRGEHVPIDTRRSGSGASEAARAVVAALFRIDRPIARGGEADTLGDPESRYRRFVVDHFVPNPSKLGLESRCWRNLHAHQHSTPPHTTAHHRHGRDDPGPRGAIDSQRFDRVGSHGIPSGSRLI